MHQSWDAQFINTTTPNFTSQRLKRFADDKQLIKKSIKVLYKTLVSASVTKIE